MAADQGAKWVAFPESAMYEYRVGDPTFASRAEPLDGPFVTAMVNLASALGIVLSAGIWEQAPAGGRPYNTHVVVSGDGLLAAYRKVHLFDALGHNESGDMRSSAPQAVTVPWRGFTVGLLTCYDIRFPEQSRALVDAGADVLLVAAAWAAGPGKRHQWETLLTARAIENTAYVVASGMVSDHHAGPSMVIDPVGETLARAAAADVGYAAAEISQERLRDVRSSMPSLTHRRWQVSPRDSAE